MRKLAFAALCGVLVLAGCGDDSRTSPMEPAPEASDAITCIKPGFPLKLALEQIAGSRNIVALYPTSRPRPLALALARVAEVAALWTFCKPQQAQAKVAVHTKILLDDFQAGRLKGGTTSLVAERAITHINTMWQGVGFQPPNPPIFPGTGTNFGFGLFIPGTPLLVRTGSNDGAVQLPANAFTEPTLVTVLLRPDEPNPFADTDFDVSPPFYEIIASNASNTHYLTDGVFAVVGFCVDDVATPIFTFGDPAIAHIAVTEGPNAGGFEILGNASTAQYDALGLACEQFSPPVPFGSLFDNGLKGFASAAPRYLRATATALFLPDRVEAAVGNTGLGGLARNLSPFGVTDRGEPLSLGIANGNNQNGFTGQILTAPLVVQVTRDAQPVPNVQVNFQVTGGGGSITPSVTTGPTGLAEATWILGSTLGAQTATASVPGSLVTFTATAAPAPPFRVVLQWGTTPNDLDAHLTGPLPPESRFHVYFGNPCHPGGPSGCLTPGQAVTLDRDDVDGNGPETITVDQQVAGTYRFSVHDFTNRFASLESPSSALAASGATVTLYLASSPTPQVFSVPNLAGTLWTVFEVSGSTVTSVNAMGYTTDPANPGAFSVLGRTGRAIQTDQAVIRDAIRSHPK